MIEIIKYGKKPTSKRKFMCDECRCMFTAEKEDFVSLEGDVDGGILHCPSPHCGNKFTWTQGYVIFEEDR